MNEKDSLLLETSDNSKEPINQSTNVLLVSRLQSLQSISKANFAIALLCLVYFGINSTLLYCNYCISVATPHGQDPPISDEAFHLTEFWATFIFAIIEAFALVQTPKPLATIYENTMVLKSILFMNIVATLVLI